VRADGAQPDSTHRRTSAIETAARECGVSPATARAWQKIQDLATEDVRLAVRQRKLSIEAGAKIAALPTADQADALTVALAAVAAAKASRKTWRRERRQRAGSTPTAAPKIEPPPASVPVLPPPSKVGAGEPSAGRLPGPPSISAPAPTLGPAAACETMCLDFAERLRRHLAQVRDQHLPAGELERCGAAVRGLHLEVLRYLCRLHGASHPALLTADNLGRLADKKLAEFAATNDPAVARQSPPAGGSAGGGA
jgi:hypothetical protein